MSRLIVSSDLLHIRADEEKKMGIKQEKMNLWQEDNDVLSSMSLLELVQDQEFAQQEEVQEGQKRAASNFSNISSDHQPNVNPCRWRNNRCWLQDNNLSISTVLYYFDQVFTILEKKWAEMANKFSFDLRQIKKNSFFLLWCVMWTLGRNSTVVSSTVAD